MNKGAFIFTLRAAQFLSLHISHSRDEFGAVFLIIIETATIFPALSLLQPAHTPASRFH
jgi:hypothetical protein